NGEFSLNLPPGRYIVRVDYEGYTSVVREVVLNRNVMLEFKLKPTIQTVITRLVMSNLNYIIVVVVGVIVGVVFIKYVKPKLKRRREISEEELFEELYSTA
ncbi:MAG TPA: PEGA domain-containing protein, partial [Desulfurococcales archaeon]|nr:PEGA domain-containing protein [Desulfurococcales archaeon]